MENWEVAFVAAVMGAATALLGYTEIRRLLHCAVDDRYGEWSRFRARAARLPGWSKRLEYNWKYAIAFFFLYGIHDLMRLVSLLAFDLFVVFAFLSPFWRSVYFDDWNPALATAIALAGASAYMVWKFRWGLQLCRVHEWSEQTWRCEKCGEYHALAEEREEKSKSAKSSGLKAPEPAKRHSGWHGIWEKRLQKLAEEVPSESQGSPRPAG